MHISTQHPSAFHQAQQRLTVIPTAYCLTCVGRPPPANVSSSRTCGRSQVFEENVLLHCQSWQDTVCTELAVRLMLPQFLHMAAAQTTSCSINCRGG